jgi:hypothetical protein
MNVGHLSGGPTVIIDKVPALETVTARTYVVPQTGRSIKITRPRPIVRAVPDPTATCKSGCNKWKWVKAKR